MNIAPRLNDFVDITTAKYYSAYDLVWLNGELTKYYIPLDILKITAIKAVCFSKYELKAIKIALIEYYHTKPTFKRMADEAFESSQKKYGYGTHIFINRQTHKSNGDDIPHFNITFTDMFGTEMEAHCYWDTQSPYPKIYKMTLTIK